MNAKKEYEKMLEITGSSCNITVKPAKRRRKVKKPTAIELESIKDELIEKVNETANDNNDIVPSASGVDETVKDVDIKGQNKTDEEKNVTVNIKSEKKKIKFGFIGAELVVIGVLLAVIFLSSVILPTSGINTFFKGVFGSETLSKDVRNYGEFSPVVPFSDKDKIELSDGIMTYSAKGSVYSPCDGKITAVYKENDKYVVEISHSENFKTVFSGIDYLYSENGDAVYSNIPIGYVTSGAEACFYNGNSVITGYTIADSTVVWAV